MQHLSTAQTEVAAAHGYSLLRTLSPPMTTAQHHQLQMHQRWHHHHYHHHPRHDHYRYHDGYHCRHHHLHHGRHHLIVIIIIIDIIVGIGAISSVINIVSMITSVIISTADTEPSLAVLLPSSSSIQLNLHQSSLWPDHQVLWQHQQSTCAIRTNRRGGDTNPCSASAMTFQQPAKVKLDTTLTTMMKRHPPQKKRRRLQKRHQSTHARVRPDYNSTCTRIFTHTIRIQTRTTQKHPHVRTSAHTHTYMRNQRRARRRRSALCIGERRAEASRQQHHTQQPHRP